MSNTETHQSDQANDLSNISGFSSLSKEYLSIVIKGQLFGIPVLQIQDVLRNQSITKIPLTHSAIAGALNLRGRIVTAIDIRKCLNLEDLEEDRKNSMSVVVENEGELYSLIVDSIGDVLRLKSEDYQPTPATLDPVWKNISQGIFRLENELLVILDIQKLLENF